MSAAEAETAFDTVYDSLIAAVSLEKKYPEDGSTKHVATVLLEELTAQRDALRARCETAKTKTTGATT